MTTTRARSEGLRLLLTTLCLTASQAIAIEHVVLDTNSAMYVEGEVLATGVEISLMAGEFLVTVAADGTSMRVDGPFEGMPRGAPPPEVEIRRAVEQLLGAAQQDRGQLGGVRGDELGGALDDDALADNRSTPWAIHTGLTGDQCVLRNRTAQLWREDVRTNARTELLDLSADQMTQVEWQIAEHLVDWPETLRIGEGRVYLMRNVNRLRPTAVRLHELDPGITRSELAAVAWLAARDCFAQAQLLLATG